MKAARPPIEDDVPLAPHTTLAVGGPARHFSVAPNETVLRECLRWAHERELPVLPLGGGSNLLVADPRNDSFPCLPAPDAATRRIGFRSRAA